MKYFKDEGKKVIKSWCDNPEEEAIIQAKNLAALPFVHSHVALMPDCLSEDSEVLTSKGFKLISEIDIFSDKVANYDEQTGRCFFEMPKAKVIRDVKKGEKIFELASTMLDKSIVMSEKHRTPLKENMGEICENLKNLTKIKDFVWGGSGLLNSSEYPITDEMLCLIAWVVGDGNIIQSNKRKDGTFSSKIVRFGFTKERKIKRVKHLLDCLDFSYNERLDTKQLSLEVRTDASSKIIKFVGLNKVYPVEFIEHLSNRQAFLFLEECLKVDGDWINYLNYTQRRYNSKRDVDINFLSSLISLHQGIASDNTRYSEGYNVKIKMHYLSVLLNSNTCESNNGFSESLLMKKEIDYSGKLVCLECSSGFFIARQKGMTFVSGNCHSGYGMPIGGVIVCDGYIIPNAVGVDIGCGMTAVKTTFTDEIDKDTLKKVMGVVRKVVPMGTGKNLKVPCLKEAMPDLPHSDFLTSLIEPARYQLGTLGSGNHFLEFQRDEENCLWIMLHSGSRKFGFEICKHYNQIARDINKKYFSIVDDKQELAFLPMDTIAGMSYFEDMLYATEFAFRNRQKMMFETMEALKNCVLKYEDNKISFDNIGEGGMINIHHNYASLEHHFGKNVYVHRKGATCARKGELGIIPGSQGSNSYIVEGLGNPESFMSCSHGAGRKMGRKKAIKELDLEKEIKILDDQGIIHGIRHTTDLDEAVGSYKDINVVMEEQKDLVNIKYKLRPIAVLKG